MSSTSGVSRASTRRPLGTARDARCERGLRLQSPDGEEDADIAVLELVEHRVGRDRRQIGHDGRPRFRVGRIAKIGRHHADDSEGSLG
jgi:hypothetical protein